LHKTAQEPAKGKVAIPKGIRYDANYHGRYYTMEARWKGGDNMSLEAVQMVTETEQRALQRKAEAVEAAKKLVSDAERAGKERVAAARADAEAQARQMMTRAEEAAAKHTETVMEETRRSCDDLRRAAEGKLEDAAALIIRRVVGV
jgi:V/A-type H+-transporting ATPase subunit G/H